MQELDPVPEDVDLAAEQRHCALLELARLPRLAEEREQQLPLAVGDDDLCADGVTTRLGLIANRVDADGFRQHGHVLPDLQVAEVGESTAVVESAGVVAEQVSDRVHAERLLQRIRRATPEDAAQGRVKRDHHSTPMSSG